MDVTSFGFTNAEVIERVAYDHTSNLEWGNHAAFIPHHAIQL